MSVEVPGGQGNFRHGLLPARFSERDCGATPTSFTPTKARTRPINGDKNEIEDTLTALALGLAARAFAQVVGGELVHFQEERWKTDEKAIKEQLAKWARAHSAADAGGLAREATVGR